MSAVGGIWPLTAAGAGRGGSLQCGVIDPESDQSGISGQGDRRILDGPSTVEDQKKVQGAGADLGIRSFVVATEREAVMGQHDHPTPASVELGEAQPASIALQL